MPASVLYAILRLLFGSLIRLRRDALADLEIAVLRHELKVLSRQNPKPNLRSSDRAFMTASARLLPRSCLRSFIVTPKTLLRWHRRLVSLKWARYAKKRRRGRPGLPAEVKEAILRLAKENPRLGYRCIHGELVNLGVEISATTVRNLLRRNGFGPAPRNGMSQWREFLSSQTKTVLACDFFTVETLLLKRYYVLFFIDIASRRVLYAGATTHPNGVWVTQQARNLFVSEPDLNTTHLIHDRDSKFTGASTSSVRRRDRLGGLIHEYYDEAA